MSNNCDETKCSGDCSTCTGDGMTVTLTLDDDSTVECAIVGVFDAAEKEYIALLPADENGQNEDGEVYLYRYAVGPTVHRSSTISRQMKNMKSFPTHSMNFWIPWSMTRSFPKMS